MLIFKRKKKTGSFDTIQLTSNLNKFYTPFGTNISKSDVVKICIDRVASQCAKLKPRYIKTENDKTVTEKKGRLSFLLKYKPNEIMTPYDFIYKTTTLLLLNDNAFIYPKFDRQTGKLKGIYPLRPVTVEMIVDDVDTYFIKFIFEDGKPYTLPYDNIIHLRRHFAQNDIFGGTGSSGDHEAILKTISINDSLLQGIDNAVKSSMQIKGIVKMNGMLSEADKKKQRDLFDAALSESTHVKGSSIIPIDLKSEYIPLDVDPKMIDKDTLEFLQSKITDYFGVSVPIFTSQYTEDEYNSFYESTIEPLAIQLSEAFSLGLLTDNQLERGEQIVFYSERLQYASWNTKVNAIEKLMSLGIMSLNESRALLGLEPIEGGHKRLQSLNFVDADKANQYQVGTKEEETNEDNN
ncbi:phage portal protein [Hujiaoplasma nucleasis]|uniref:Phage portal protein n=1 Tax=Hujiaoplasma nucleasis TaxID=2725268 RepID=A0A7L6N1N4_9MOLU|nr:phage portal protein [Hujiaoplasma nucleasis]QLY40180.1 phage portal protein [Hujiaoplasma nucleasis]